jgi:hypothetical protein
MKDVNYADNMRERMLAWATILEDIDLPLAIHLLGRIRQELTELAHEAENDGLPWLVHKVFSLEERASRDEQTLRTLCDRNNTEEGEEDEENEQEGDERDFLGDLVRRLRDDAQLYHFVLKAKAAEDWLALARKKE